MTWNPSLLKCGAAMISAGFILALFVTREVVCYGSWSKFTRYLAGFSTCFAVCSLGIALPLDPTDYHTVSAFFGNITAFFFGVINDLLHHNGITYQWVAPRLVAKLL